MTRHTCRRMASVAWNRIGVVQVYRSEPIGFRKAVPPKPAFCNTTGPCILKPGVRPTQLRFIAMGQREKEHGACHERRAKEAALSAATAPHLLHRPHLRSSLFTGWSDTWLEFMSCSVALGVMPHSATSRVTGDDMSTIISWNSGV